MLLGALTLLGLVGTDHLHTPPIFVLLRAKGALLDGGQGEPRPAVDWFRPVLKRADAPYSTSKGYYTEKNVFCQPKIIKGNDDPSVAASPHHLPLHKGGLVGLKIAHRAIRH
jgi:hypothetical protein